ncbi:MAG: cation-translocating P-type ATPase [Oscillospiraceae bacterium]|nr:cation-translocating P-type ATPase [Oscillospiraceae bacterium]
MKYSTEKLANIFEALLTDPDKGLSDQQVIGIQKEKGLNRFEEGKKESVLQKILHHLRDFTSLILLTAGAIALYLAISDPSHGYTDVIVIFAIVVINITLAVRQELGAEKALDALKKMNAHMTVVIRNGDKQSVDAEQLVPGDILLLGAGDMIPADARIIESVNLKVEESALTGESISVEKDADAEVDEKATLGDQLNMLFSGCLITNGRTKAVVAETGMTTEMGKIAGLLNDTKKERTPLQQKMDALGKVICVIAILSAAALFALQYFSEPLPIVLLNAVSMAVAVIPECLPVIVTITLAYGVFNMAKKNAIIRKIPAVETLGSASVICSDKTGTLTMNRMSIQRIWAVGYEPRNAREEFSHDETRLLEMMGLASNASIGTHDGEEKVIGDPTETAIIRLLRDKGIEKPSIDAIFPKVFEIPFDSERKLMTTVHKTDDLENVHYISITKGAFDRIPIDAASVCGETAKRIHDQFAGDALRVLAVAFKYYDTLPETLDASELEHGLTFAGFVGMIDPPRPESKAAVQTAKEAGIKTVMITGDHAITASAIAREIGILSEGEKVITGAELALKPEDELFANVKDYSVYARVSPEDKIRIVQAWQKHGETVAMTGDGVNDAPALKAADVGVAMGSGTDVSKNASDVILTDDNFASIVDAVAEGRRVYDNIRKVLYSLLACNISEIFTMLFVILFWKKAPLVAIQMLFINVIADGIPDLCLCREPLEDDAMKRKPIRKNASIFADGLRTRVAVVAVVFAAASITGYYIGRFVTVSPHFPPSHEIGMTMAYVAVGWSSVFNIFNVRSFNKSIFQIGFMSNRLLFGGICFSLVLVFITAFVPGIRDIFYCVPVSLNHWLITVYLSITPLIAVEFQKLFIRRGIRKST